MDRVAAAAPRLRAAATPAHDPYDVAERRGHRSDILRRAVVDDDQLVVIVHACGDGRQTARERADAVVNGHDDAEANRHK
jgi:hypothetical protein